MFDVGFLELLIIFVIGLLVLGPERLPKVAAKVGNWVGQARRMTRNLKYQLEDEIALQERKEAAQKFVADLDKEITGEATPDSTSPDEANSIQPPSSTSEKGPPV
ncbi:MAG: Sec-independent protein translocase protein TatB [Pseudomonadota bacterium]